MLILKSIRDWLLLFVQIGALFCAVVLIVKIIMGGMYNYYIESVYSNIVNLVKDLDKGLIALVIIIVFLVIIKLNRKNS
jgi:hypothetical protein